MSSDTPADSGLDVAAVSQQQQSAGPSMAPGGDSRVAPPPLSSSSSATSSDATPNSNALNNSSSNIGTPSDGSLPTKLVYPQVQRSQSSPGPVVIDQRISKDLNNQQSGAAVPPYRTLSAPPEDHPQLSQSRSVPGSSFQPTKTRASLGPMTSAGPGAGSQQQHQQIGAGVGGQYHSMVCIPCISDLLHFLFL